MEVPAKSPEAPSSSGWACRPSRTSGFTRAPRKSRRLHIAFRADNRALVDAFYRAAIAAGGNDNGPPGLRPHYHKDYYGAFVLDPDGHNIEACCHTRRVRAQRSPASSSFWPASTNGAP